MIKEFIEYNDSILEFAQITSNNDFFRQKYGNILVSGGGENGNRREHNPPHFLLKFNDGERMRIIIPENIQDELIELDGNLDGKMKKDLIKWFNLKNEDAKLYNNYQMLKIQWNTLNKNDKNIRKFTNI